MFPVTVTINTAAQLNAVMAALNVDQIIESPKTIPAKADKKEEKAEAKKQEPSGQAPASSAQAAAAQPTATETAAPATKAENSDAAPALKYDDVAKAVLAVSAKHGREKAVGLLKEFGLDTLKAAKPEQFADIKAAADKAL